MNAEWMTRRLAKARKRHDRLAIATLETALRPARVPTLRIAPDGSVRLSGWAQPITESELRLLDGNR